MISIPVLKFKSLIKILWCRDTNKAGSQSELHNNVVKLLGSILHMLTANREPD